MGLAQGAGLPDSQNAFVDYAKAAALIRTDRFSAYASYIPPQNRGDLTEPENAAAKMIWELTPLQVDRLALTDFKPVLALIQQGNQKRYAPPPEDLAADSFPMLAQYKQIAKVSVKAAYAMAANGDTRGAASLLLDMLRFARSIGSSSVLCHLVGIAINAIEFRGFQTVIDRLSDTDWVYVRGRLDDLLAQPDDLASVLHTEGQTKVRYFDALVQNVVEHPDDLDKMDSEPDDHLVNLAHRILAMSPAQRIALRATFVKLVQDNAARVLAESRKPEASWSFPAVQSADPDLDGIGFDLISDESIEQYFSAILKSRTQMRLLRLNAFVQSYKWNYGNLPEKLADAVPAADLLDPLNGGEFQYELKSAYEYRLSSAGNKRVPEMDLVFRRPPNAPDDDPTPIKP